MAPGLERKARGLLRGGRFARPKSKYTRRVMRRAMPAAGPVMGKPQAGKGVFSWLRSLWSRKT